MNITEPNSGPLRIQVEFARERVQELDALADYCDLATRKELFNNALSLFEWAVNEVKRKNIIASVNEEERTYKQVVMTALSAAASKAAREAHVHAAS
jgi:hypothetical protein